MRYLVEYSNNFDKETDTIDCDSVRVSQETVTFYESKKNIDNSILNIIVFATSLRNSTILLVEPKAI